MIVPDDDAVHVGVMCLVHKRRVWETVNVDGHVVVVDESVVFHNHVLRIPEYGYGTLDDACAFTAEVHGHPMVGDGVTPDPVVFTPCMVDGMPRGVLYIVVVDFTIPRVGKMDAIPLAGGSTQCADNPVVVYLTVFDTFPRPDVVGT